MFDKSVNKQASDAIGAQALPETLRAAVRGAEETGRRAQERAMLAMPFRARLRAREGVRPLSTLAIVTGNDPKTDVFSVSRNVEPASLPMRDVRRGASHLSLASSSAAVAYDTRDQSFPPPPPGGNGSSSDDDDEVIAEADESERSFAGRLGDLSQFAFAGLAVLGLAGLSVMAAESALKGKTDSADPSGEAASNPMAAIASAPGGEAVVQTASVAAEAPAVQPVPWFDYRGIADLLAARKAEADRQFAQEAAVEAERVRLAETKAAAAAIAEAEAQRTAEAARASADTEAAKLAADAAEKKRLADLEAERVAAKAAADKLAEEKRLAAVAAAEAKRAEVAAAKVQAEREAEAVRVAKIAADKKAAEERHIAELERQRLAALEAETARAAKVATAAAAAPKPREPLVMVAHEGPIPAPASLKPPRPAITFAASSAAPARADMSSLSSAPVVGTSRSVTRVVPQSYQSTSVNVRPLADSARTAPRLVDEFLAERVKITSAVAPVSDASLVAFRADFIRLVEIERDGTRHTLKTPDGRDVTILFERTKPIEWTRASVRTIAPAAVSDSGSLMRYASEPQPQRISVMCRDVAYAFPGQERGRFAACKAPEGGWTLARATDIPGQPI